MLVTERIPMHLKPETDGIETTAQLPRVAAIYDGVENGRRPGLLMKDRAELTKAIRAAKKQGLDGLSVLSRVGEFYPVADVEAYLRERRAKRRLTRITAATALILSGVFTHYVDQPQASEHAVAPDAMPRGVAEPLLETTTTAPPTTTIEQASSTTTSSTSQVPAPVPTSSSTPPPATSTTNVAALPFDQRHFGPVSSIVIDEAFSLEVKQIGQRTGDVNVNNRAELYEYVDTLADFNGIDANHVQSGQRISFHDCPDNGDVIRAGDTAGTFAERNGLGVQEVHQLNNGNLQVVAGWCGRIATE